MLLNRRCVTHGFDPADAIIEIAPRKNEHAIRTEDVLEIIAANSNTLATILIGGVNYLSGQFFRFKTNY